ncbi:MAG: hypothetical protein ACXVIY_00915 [Mucilaginibacter sp.]
MVSRGFPKAYLHSTASQFLGSEKSLKNPLTMLGIKINKETFFTIVLAGIVLTIVNHYIESHVVKHLPK